MTNESPITIQAVAQNLAEDLKSYIEAQYHIRDESILKERRALLDEGQAVAQRPFIESTPSYQLDVPYGKLGLPERTSKLLTAVAGYGAGLYPRPYIHQAHALKAFVAKKDILAATGTGSGKTEIFLLSILASLAEESKLGPPSTMRSGCRALILYPMNALVSDQLSRLRILLGNDQVKAALKALRGRVARFGMYTSRTPFPGLRPRTKDEDTKTNKQRVTELWKKRYAPILADRPYLEKLKQRGKWPAKDVESFFGSGRWDNRLNTGPDDAELLMRHEMQESCPDILITNYSMLEYMLVRPIERTIFEQTSEWLASDSSNYFTIVLDEAHLYRGATGAEVSFLLRRLISRLGITRDRVRFILTTASVGKTDEHRDRAINFACDLTGLKREDKDRFAFIPGSVEKLLVASPATQEQTLALESFDGVALQQNLSEPEGVRALLSGLGSRLGWAGLDTTPDLQDALYKGLWQFPPAGCLVKLISGDAKAVDEIAEKVFPAVDSKPLRDKALDSLLRICNFAKESSTGKVFLPARLHLFFRGLSGLYACVDPQCSRRRYKQADGLIGRLYSEPRVSCDCGARVYEVFTDRDCGAPFLLGFVRPVTQPDFVWHEPTTEISRSGQEEHRLVRMQFYLSLKPRFAQVCSTVWMQIRSGQISWDAASPGEGWTRMFAPNPTYPANYDVGGHLFGDCPSCGEEVQDSPDSSSRIMDLRTKGEQPFGQLVKGQFLCQVGDKKIDHPNRGRKVLLFSDGRQKAARLAKSIPTEVELDSFRELLALGFKRCQRPQTKLPLTRLYLLFIDACAEAGVIPFGKEGTELARAVTLYRDRQRRDFDELLADPPATVPMAFRESLYRQVSGGLYSMRFICAGWIWPKEQAMWPIIDAFKDRLSAEEVTVLAATWIQGLARAYAIDAEVPSQVRQRIAGFSGRRNWGHNGKFGKNFRPTLKAQLADIDQLEKALQHAFGPYDSKTKAHFLNPNDVCLRFDLSHHWFRCEKCKLHSAYTFRGHCPVCSSNETFEADPRTDEYIQSRKGYWRKPLELVFEGRRTPTLISVEEHTAQLTHSDPSKGVPLVEDYEMRFQGILRAGQEPVDVLSCTTTMEVGIDIGSLVAVGLRNVPPQRENYQQRAGRAGRRGSSVSSVVTYCQGGAHDNYYYSRVEAISSGAPRHLRVKVDNEKIARRHVHAYLLQSFFATQAGNDNPSILSSLGSLDDFFKGESAGSLDDFESWIRGHVDELVKEIVGWVIRLESESDLSAWAKRTVDNFIELLRELIGTASEVAEREKGMDDGDKTELLGFCLSESLLPTYAFPTNLASFRVEQCDSAQGLIESAYEAQLAAPRALTEYAPGQFVTIDKNDYQSTVVTASVSVSKPDRAAPLFNNPHSVPYIFCSEHHCSYVENAVTREDAYKREGELCHLCSVGRLMVKEMISPQVYMPVMGSTVNELEDDREYTRASPAQFPVPVHSDLDQDQDKIFGMRDVSPLLKVFRRSQADLVVVNKGDIQDPQGFAVCKSCGLSNLILGNGNFNRAHQVPYAVSAGPGRVRNEQSCYGQMTPVFLGHRFSSDLSVIRASIGRPLCLVPQAQAAHYVALQDGLQTLAEALTMGAARYFDVDPTEFSSGYRLILQASNPDAPLLADLYMFDTLSGGAGYSQQLGEHVEDILKDVRKILSCEDEHCDRSCYKCIRHYQNQNFNDRLDRKIALDLLAYLYEEVPLVNPNLQAQEAALLGLREMLKLSGLTVKINATVNGSTVPLVVLKGSKTLAVYVTHPLIEPDSVTGLLDDLDGVVEVRPLNGYYLSRNLPACCVEVMRCLER
jgi:ATP-dependent helicase YprA (DUF1998 family)